jgi:hypothetical protein
MRTGFWISLLHHMPTKLGSTTRAASSIRFKPVELVVSFRYSCLSYLSCTSLSPSLEEKLSQLNLIECLLIPLQAFLCTIMQMVISRKVQVSWPSSMAERWYTNYQNSISRNLSSNLEKFKSLVHKVVKILSKTHSSHALLREERAQ